MKLRAKTNQDQIILKVSHFSYCCKSYFITLKCWDFYPELKKQATKKKNLIETIIDLNNKNLQLTRKTNLTLEVLKYRWWLCHLLTFKIFEHPIQDKLSICLIETIS